ncbi:NADAR domain-containing protein [Xenorhabdus budapestensis]
MYIFSQNPSMERFLLQTGDKVLVEASPVDRIWGIGMAEDNSNICNPLTWDGLNLLGFALMTVREKLKK